MDEVYQYQCLLRRELQFVSLFLSLSPSFSRLKISKKYILTANVGKILFRLIEVLRLNLFLSSCDIKSIFCFNLNLNMTNPLDLPP